jgi:hypothetical protein
VDEEHGSIAEQSRAPYYSAYLWIKFVIMVKRQDGRLRPLNFKREDGDHTAKAGLDFLPFFEHCNIACPFALEMSKNVLALKALEAIRQLVMLSGGPSKTPLRFVYACAIDDPGDGNGTWLEELKLCDPRDSKLVELLGAMGGDPRVQAPGVRPRTEYAELFASVDPIVQLNHYDGWKDRQPHDTHKLIEHIHDVLETV